MSNEGSEDVKKGGEEVTEPTTTTTSKNPLEEDTKKEEEDADVSTSTPSTEEKNTEDKEKEGDEEVKEAEDEDKSMKLFVGQIPKTMMEDEIKSLFEKFGEVMDVSVIRDKINGNHRGCAFVTFSEANAANESVEAYHDKKTLPKMHNPMQVKPAYVFGSNRTNVVSRRPPSEIKLFVGMVPHSATEDDVRELFVKHGTVEEVYILRDKAGDSRGCAFVRYTSRDEALKAIEELHHKITMEGSPSSLVVKFADSKREKSGRRGHRHHRHRHRQDGGRGFRGGRHHHHNNRTSGDRGRSGSSSFGQSPGVMGFGGQNWTGQPGQQQYGGLYGMPPQGYPGSYGSTAGYYGYGGYGVSFSPTGYNYPVSPSGYFTPPSFPPGPMPSTPISSSSKLTVQHIPKEYKDSDLQRLFSPFGKIQEARILGKSDGGLQTGVVVYKDPVSTRAALDNMNGFEAGSSRLVVSPAPPKSSSTSTE